MGRKFVGRNIRIAAPPVLASILLAALLLAGHALAGNQKEEALADGVRIALSNAIADARPPKPKIDDINERIKYLHWLGEMSNRLQHKLTDRQQRREFLETVWYESKRAGLDPSLVLGLIQVESAFRKYAMSHVGARGYMQVMPFWTRVIGDRDPKKLFHMQTNLRYGCSILRLYLEMEKGDLFLALGRYNGSRGRSEYPDAVRAAWKRWEFVYEAPPAPVPATPAHSAAVKPAPAAPVMQAAPAVPAAQSMQPMQTVKPAQLVQPAQPQQPVKSPPPAQPAATASPASRP